MARGRRTKKQVKGGKKGVPSRAQRDKQALESLAEKRRAFEPLLQQVVAGVLHAEAPESEPGSEQRWVEVGSGLGQLRSLLPPEVLDYVTHTELSKSLARGLAERHPDARVLAADVTRLPFESGTVDVVMGLCAFDSFPKAEESAKEIGRVLRKGGRFIHFLDAATNVEPILIDLVKVGRLPLPNFLADTALLEPALLDMNRLGQFCGPYHDMLSVPFEQFEFVTAMLSRTRHPMTEMLQKYAAPFLKLPFDSLNAARAFVGLTSDIRKSRPMNQALTSLISTLMQPPYTQHIAFELVAHSSLAHFQSRLDGYFGADFGFVPRLSKVIYARAYEPNLGEPLRAHIRRVGIVQNSVHWPEPVGVPAQQLKDALPNPAPGEATPQSHILREAAVYCLVAERSAST